MRISVDVQMQYQFPQPNTVALVLEAAHAPGQEIVSASMNLGDATVDRIAGDCGVGERIWARVGTRSLRPRYVPCDRQFAAGASCAGTKHSPPPFSHRRVSVTRRAPSQ